MEDWDAVHLADANVSNDYNIMVVELQTLGETLVTWLDRMEHTVLRWKNSKNEKNTSHRNCCLLQEIL